MRMFDHLKRRLEKRAERLRHLAEQRVCETCVANYGSTHVCDCPDYCDCDDHEFDNITADEALRYGWTC